jgi:hypothetical protein
MVSSLGPYDLPPRGPSTSLRTTPA